MFKRPASISRNDSEEAATTAIIESDQRNAYGNKNTSIHTQRLASPVTLRPVQVTIRAHSIK